MTNPEIVVTGHAMARYRERVCDGDHSSVRAAILSAVMPAAALVAARVPCTEFAIRRDEATYVIKSGCVVTVLPPGRRSMYLPQGGEGKDGTDDR